MNKISCFLRHKISQYSLAILIGSALFSACKENTILPSTLVPAVDNVYTFFTDTTTLVTSNILQDSLLTGGLLGSNRVSNSATFYHALGAITSDPIFGKTHASFHVEVLPPKPNFAFETNATGTNRTIDSIVLSIPYKGVYGDTLSGSSQTFKVYRSLKSFPRDSAQYDFTKDSVEHSLLLASQTVNFKTFATDSPLVGNVKLQPQLRFKLASWFADSLQAQVDAGINGAANDYSKYLEWWKGFAVEADSNNGSALGFFDTYNTRMHIYYRYTNSSNVADTSVDIFSFDPTYCNRFNTISRNYNGTIAKNHLNTTNVNGDSVLFVQTEPGMATILSFPNLANFENVVVNKAELVFTAVSPYYNWIDTAFYGITPRLQLIASDNNGLDAVLQEYPVFGSNFVDGKRSVLSENGNNYIQYHFVISQTIQKLISQKNTTFRLKIMGLNTGMPASYRVLLRGSGSQSSTFKPKLNLIYTKINK
jgi:hypothetical protein